MLWFARTEHGQSATAQQMQLLLLGNIAISIWA
jgi:hypothetical protein